MQKMCEVKALEHSVSKQCESVVNSFLLLAESFTTIEPEFTFLSNGEVVVQWSNDSDQFVQVNFDKRGSFFIRSTVDDGFMQPVHPGGFTFELAELENTHQ